ncbi:MAG: TetR/AcrR family transcriptional regulator [Halioglobus sp.]
MSKPLTQAPDDAGAASTRERLLLTALELYASQGIKAVSLRTISAAAGSKNSAAMHYHFGNKAGVIQALVNMIAKELQKLTQDVREQKGQSPSLRDKFRNTLYPIVQLARYKPWGANAIRFMSRALAEADPEIAAAINPVYETYWRRIDENLALLMPELPDEVRQLRLMFMSTNVVHGVAEVANLAYTPLGDLSHINPDELLNHLVDYLIGGMKAPSLTTTVPTQEEPPHE